MKKNYYAIIPANVRYDNDLTPNAKLLYAEITALSNEKGFCWASNDYFSDLYKTSKRSVSRWIKQLIDKNYIQPVFIYKEGTKEIEQRYLYLVNTGMDKNDNTCRQKCPTPADKNVLPPIDKNGADNNINYINNKINNINIYSRVIEKLNDSCATSYKPSTKKTQSLIKARLAEGFTESDFYKVIENKVLDWKDTEFEKYLRPETLFGPKFENYLNEKQIKKKVVDSKQNGKFEQYSEYLAKRESKENITENELRELERDLEDYI